MPFFGMKTESVTICHKWMLYYRVKKEGLYVF